MFLKFEKSCVSGFKSNVEIRKHVDEQDHTSLFFKTLLVLFILDSDSIDSIYLIRFDSFSRGIKTHDIIIIDDV